MEGVKVNGKAIEVGETIEIDYSIWEYLYSEGRLGVDVLKVNRLDKKKWEVAYYGSSTSVIIIEKY